MKFGYAWTFGEEPEKRTPSLPRPPAGLRNSNWAASPRRACFRLLGGFRIRFGYLERPQAPSRPGEFHPEPLTDPDLILSHHPARVIGRKLPPSVVCQAPPVTGWPNPTPMTRPLRSSPITGPSPLTWGWGRSRGLFRGRMACVIFLSCFSIQGLSPVARPGGVASPCRSKLTYGRRSESAAPTSRLRAVRTQGDVTSLLPGVESHATNRFVHLGLPGMISCPAIAFTFLCAAGSSRLHDRPFDHDPGSHVFPQRDQQLAR